MRKRKPKDSVNTNEWMNTYADTVTLLLCFFILLFSSSTMNEAKWKQIVIALTGKWGDTEITEPRGKTDDIPDTPIPEIPDIEFPETGDKQEPGASPSEPDSTKVDLTPNDRLYETIRGYIDDQNLTSKVELIKSERTVTLRFKDSILFDPDSAVLRADGKQILADVCDILKRSIEQIQMIHIEGHTASRPSGQPEFPNSFEFSTLRAVNVLDYAMLTAGIDRMKLSAVGYGQYHPIADNDTEEGRTANRRVEIIVTSLLPPGNDENA